MPQDNSGWTPVDDAAISGWSPVEKSAKPSNKLTSLETKPKSYFERHPYQREGALGAFSGLGVPESKTPVKDIGRGLAKTFELGPNELDKSGFDRVMSYIPVVGPVYRMGAGLGEQTYDFGKQLLSNDPKERVHGAAGLTTEALSLLWGAKKGEVVPGEGKINRMTAATGGYPEDLKAVQGDLDAAAKTHGKPHDAAGLRDLSRKALDANTTEFSTALQPVSGKKVVPIQIADAIKKKITPEMMQDAKGRQMAKELLQESTTYQKRWSLGDLYRRKQRYDAEGASYFKKSESGRTNVQRTSVDDMVESAVREGVKDIVYPELDKAAGKPSGYFRELQQRQSSLIKVKDAADSTVKELGRKESLIKGAPMRQKIVKRVSGYIHPLSGRGGVSLHKLTDPVGLTELSAADAAARSSFKPHPVEALDSYIRSFKPTTAGKGVPVVLPRNDRELHPLE